LSIRNKGFKKVITRFLNGVMQEGMQEEAAQRVGADHYERTANRSTYRNGITKRNLVITSPAYGADDITAGTYIKGQ
jgi:transposase-like protein